MKKSLSLNLQEQVEATPKVVEQPILDFVDKVLLFNKIAGTEDKFNARKTALYVGLILEEAGELIESFGDQSLPELGKLRVSLEYHSKLFKEGAFDNHAKNINRVEALDAGIDIAVVALGLSQSLGSDVQAACHNIADSNLSKFTQQPNGEYVVLKDANGKIMKPESFIPANVKPYLL